MSSTKNPLQGISPADAAEKLRGTPARELDVDWLGIDPTGALAVFLGGEETPVPSRADPEATSLMLERIAASVKARLEDPARPNQAYRVAGSRTQEPIFDAPSDDYSERTVLRAHHEKPFEGYPHLVFAIPGREALVRSLLTELGGREVLARGLFAVSFSVLGPISHEELHEGACYGCRVLDDPNDPRPRAPEALASSGLYVYGWNPEGWARIASPTVPADRDDLREVGLAAVVAMPDVFDATTFIPHHR